MHYLITGAGVLIALAFIALSAAINWRYGLSLGRDPADQQIFAAISLTADLAKAITPFFFWYALKHRNILPALASLLFWVACTGYSLSSAAGFAELSRATQTGTLTTKKENYADLQADMLRKQDQLKQLGTYQPPTVLEQQIEALRQNPRWTSSRQCTDTTIRASRELCAQIATLQAERQKGLTASRLETEIQDLRKTLGDLAPASRLEGGDPRAGFVTRIFGWEILNVQTGFALLFIAVLEIGSGLGLFVALSHGELGRAIKTGHLPDAPPEKLPAPAPKPRAGQGSRKGWKPRLPTWRPSVPAFLKATPKETATAAGQGGSDAVRPEAKRVSAPHPAPAPAPPEQPAIPAGNVGKFARAKLTAAEGESVSFDDLFAAYGAWCANEKLRPFKRTEFEASFLELCKKVDFRHEERGRKTIFLDIHLAN